MHIPGCQKNGAFHIGIQKNRAIHILFVEKRGPIIYLAALKKGAIRHAHPYYTIYRKLPPPPPPPTRCCLTKISRTRHMTYVPRNIPPTITLYQDDQFRFLNAERQARYSNIMLKFFGMAWPRIEHTTS